MKRPAVLAQTSFSFETQMRAAEGIASILTRGWGEERRGGGRGGVDSTSRDRAFDSGDDEPAARFSGPGIGGAVEPERACAVIF